MELKAKANKTSVDCIGRDWVTVRMSDLCALQRGFDITKNESTPGKVPVYSSSGLSYFHDRSMALPPVLITGRKGILGKVFLVSEPCWPHDTTLWATDFKGNDPDYVALLLESLHLERFDAATAVPTLNRNNLDNHDVAIPFAKAEQQAIVEVLSDTDAFIEALEQLLAKKRLLQQGVMQELLTGKRRLPGFRGEWKFKTFEAIFEYLSTATNSRSDLADSGDAFYLHYGDIHTKFSGHLDFRTTLIPRIDLSKCRNVAPLKNGDWVMADASENLEGIGKVVEILGIQEETLAVAGLHTILHREKTSTFALGFKGHLGKLRTLHDQMLRVSTGMKVFAVSRVSLKDISLPIPPLPEQTAIATVLSDMDAEIAAIEAKIAKARQIRQGMMQELLSGRIRLV